MHRLIIGAKTGEITDHINGNKLDNRKENLRICSREQNNWNVRRKGVSKYGYIGVRKNRNKWQSYISVNSKYMHLGSFNTIEEAANAYDKAAVGIRGKYAVLNNPEPSDDPYYPPEQ